MGGVQTGSDGRPPPAPRSLESGSAPPQVEQRCSGRQNVHGPVPDRKRVTGGGEGGGSKRQY